MTRLIRGLYNSSVEAIDFSYAALGPVAFAPLAQDISKLLHLLRIQLAGNLLDSSSMQLLADGLR